MDERAYAEFTHAQRSGADRGDVAFYRDRATDADGPVLELGCGTGRVYLPLVRAGVDADGLDASRPALSVLRDNATDVEPSVWQADMTAFEIDRTYALVTCPFNTLQELVTHDAQLSTLRRVHDVLAPGGEFVFDVFVPNFEMICQTYGEWQTRTVEFRGRPHEHRTRARLVDGIEQVVAVETKVVGPDGDELFADTHRMTMLPNGELELLAEHSPFVDWTVTGDFTDEPLADGHSVQVWSLQKRGESV